MRWTTDLPTSQGWYWRRPAGGKFAELRHVVDCEDTGRLECGEMPLVAGRHEWSDRPIDKPTEDAK
jgi:hypothetical protein